MKAGQMFMLFASVAVAVLGLVSSQRIRVYGAAKPPKIVLKRIEETRKPLACEAHVLPTSVVRTATTLVLTVNLRGISSHVNSTFFLLDELYINLGQGNSISRAQGDQELWVEEVQNKTSLARVPLTSSKNGYRAIKMRRVFASWSGNNQKAGFLKLKLPSTQTQLAVNLQTSKIYFVIYAYSTSLLIMPKSVHCDYYDVIVKPQTLQILNTPFSTKICSPPDEITFPFNSSTYFDMGAALRKSLKDKPVPRNAAVLRNPKCCHETTAVSRRFAGLSTKENTLRIVKLDVKITECGCPM